MRVLYWIVSVFMGMVGGQSQKAVRRFGIPLLAFALKRNLPLLLLIPILSIGYGQNSWLHERLDNDTPVRLVYGLLLSIPFLFYGFRNWFVSLTLLVLAFQVRAGSLGHVSWFGDFLLEDVVRYGTLSFLIVKIIFRKEKINVDTER